LCEIQTYSLSLHKFCLLEQEVEFRFSKNPLKLGLSDWIKFDSDRKPTQ